MTERKTRLEPTRRASKLVAEGHRFTNSTEITCVDRNSRV
jgi:hypothetical protein